MSSLHWQGIVLCTAVFVGCTSYHHEDWLYPGADDLPAVSARNLNIALVHGSDRRAVEMTENPELMPCVMHDLQQLLVHGVLSDIRRTGVARRIAIDPALLALYDYIFVLQLGSDASERVWVQVDGFSPTGADGFHSEPITLGRIGGTTFDATHYPTLRKGIAETSQAIAGFLNRASPALMPEALETEDQIRIRQFALLNDPELTRFRQRIQELRQQSEEDPVVATGVSLLAKEYQSRMEQLEILRQFELGHAEKLTEATEQFFAAKTAKIDDVREQYLAAKKAEQEAETMAAIAGVAAVAGAAAGAYASAEGIDSSGLMDAAQHMAQFAGQMAEQARQLRVHAESVAYEGSEIIEANFGLLEKYPEYKELEGTIFQIRRDFMSIYVQKNRPLEELLYEIESKRHRQYEDDQPFEEIAPTI